MQEIRINCRCCLKSPTSKFFNDFVEFDKYVDGTQKIANLFESLTSIKVDLKNSKICGDCLEKLKSSYGFREMCLTSNRYFEGGTFKIKEENPDPEYPEFVPVKVKLELGNETTEEDQNLLEEEDIKVDPENIQTLKQEPEVQIKAKQAISDKKNKTKTSTKRKKLNETISSSKKNVATQNSDLTKEGNPSKLKESGTSVVDGYACVYCAKVFTSRNTCSKHEKRVHVREMKFGCDHCGKYYMMKHQIKVHLYSHFNIKNFTCELCSKSFVTKQQIGVHKRYSHNQVEKKVQCPHCDLKFFHKSAMEIHLKVHGDEKPFKCEFEGCGKAFRKDSSLKEHAKYHLSEIFDCEICGIKCKHVVTFRAHMRQHKLDAANIVFTCDVCSKTFKHKASLSNHKQSVHTDFKPYGCTYCDLRFALKCQLRIHVYGSHITNTFQCELCPQTFRLKKFFQKVYVKHVESQHTELNAEQLENFKEKIKKLRFTDLATDLPDNFADMEADKECKKCHLRFSSAKQLETHLKLKCTKV